jgi:hypothetical protein
MHVIAITNSTGYTFAQRARVGALALALRAALALARCARLCG